MNRIVLFAIVLLAVLAGRRPGSLEAPLHGAPPPPRPTLGAGEDVAACENAELPGDADVTDLSAFDFGEASLAAADLDGVDLAQFDFDRGPADFEDREDRDLDDLTLDEEAEYGNDCGHAYERADDFDFKDAEDDDDVEWDGDDAAAVPSPAVPEELVVSAARLRELGRVPAEFEHQDALLLGAGELVWAAPDILAGIVSAVERRIGIVVLFDSEHTRKDVLELLRQNDLPPDSVTFLSVPHDTMWVRDYGPLGRVRDDGKVAYLDTLYGEVGRVSDDDTPARLSISLGIPHADVPLRLDGGNLLTNGEGLCLTTRVVLEENGIEEAAVIEILDEYLGCEQAVLLEPIEGEDTGHVDMFSVFTAADTVVVGRYDEEDDAENCALLDRNADRLAEIRTRSGPLRVVRLPMPSAADGVWRTFTNVVFANGCLLVPTYSGDASREEHEAFSIYRRLLPSWDIRGIDASMIVASGGALHCVTRNVFSLRGRRDDVTPRWVYASPPAAGAAIGLESEDGGASPDRGLTLRRPHRDASAPQPARW